MHSAYILVKLEGWSAVQVWFFFRISKKKSLHINKNKTLLVWFGWWSERLLLINNKKLKKKGWLLVFIGGFSITNSQIKIAFSIFKLSDQIRISKTYNKMFLSPCYTFNSFLNSFLLCMCELGMRV